MFGNSFSTSYPATLKKLGIVLPSPRERGEGIEGEGLPWNRFRDLGLRLKRGVAISTLSLISLSGICASPQNQPEGPKNPARQGQALTQEERKDLREKYQRFRQLPPEEQERLRRRLREFESLSEEQRNTLRRRQEFLKQLTPEQRQRVRQFYRHWRNMPPERRRRVAQRVSRLRQLPPEERERALSQMPFWQKLDPDQRKALKDLMERFPESPSPQ